jgi:hypothetical protein
MSPVRVNIFFFILFFSQREAIFFEKRKWRKNLIFGSRRHIFESHWRRRREQKIVLKAGFFLCHVSLQRGTPTLVSVVTESKQKKKKGEAIFLFFLLSNFFILIHGVPIFFFVLREKAIFF